MSLPKDIIEFDWDEGNRNKSYSKHEVTNEECEEAFFDPHKHVFSSSRIVYGEVRYVLAGQTKNQRLLFVVFTIRKNKIRIISARDLNKKEKRLYEETI